MFNTEKWSNLLFTCAYLSHADNSSRSKTTFVEPQGPRNNHLQSAIHLTKFPANTYCHRCHCQVKTNVDKNISLRGCFWAMCFSGCYLLWMLPLVWHLDCFQKYSHYCPRCNVKIKDHIPQPGSGEICIMISLIILALAILSAACYMVYFIVTYIIANIFPITETINGISNSD